MVASSKWDTIDVIMENKNLQDMGVLNFKTSREFDNGVEGLLWSKQPIDLTFSEPTNPFLGM